MKAKTAYEINKSDIYLIPEISFKLSLPDIVDMDWKWGYKEITFTIKFIIFQAGIKISFEKQ